jgi:hypothetical protein
VQTRGGMREVAADSANDAAPNVAIQIERSHNLTNNATSLLAICGGVIALVPITAIFLNVFNSEELISFHISSAIGIIVCVLLIISIQSYHRRKVISLLESIDIAWDEEEALDLGWIIEMVNNNRGGKLSKEIDETTGAATYVTRGDDQKGPDWGRSDSGLSNRMLRRDAIHHGEKYEGMEGELTKGEVMVATVDDIAATQAQRRWEEAEANDPEVIEAGVERLGDLVREGHFDRTADEGAMRRLTGSFSEEE